MKQPAFYPHFVQEEDARLAEQQALEAEQARKQAEDDAKKKEKKKSKGKNK